MNKGGGGGGGGAKNMNWLYENKTYIIEQSAIYTFFFL